jgi:hypothetical protein
VRVIDAFVCNSIVHLYSVVCWSTKAIHSNIMNYLSLIYSCLEPAGGHGAMKVVVAAALEVVI